jgi:hypothetical protein
MKIVITGHTSGLGKQIYDHLKSEHSVIGLSRSNGYDLTQNYSQVLDTVKNADIFFNNAYSGIVQSDFINDLANAECAVVTSGSMAANYDHSQYCLDKRIIEDTYNNHKKEYAGRSLLLKMGYLENNTTSQCIPIAYSEIIKAIEFWLITPRCSMIEFRNILKPTI